MSSKSSKKRKLTIIINGLSGVGKDTICDIVSRHYRVKNISSITPIKEIAKKGGWDGKKDLRGRRLLAALKRAYVEYNDSPDRYISRVHSNFLYSEDVDILFVHIREPDEIDKFKNTIERIGENCITLLIRREPRSEMEMKYYSQSEMESVENYHYDFCYTNVFGREEEGKEESLKRLEKDFIKFFRGMRVPTSIYDLFNC